MNTKQLLVSALAVLLYCNAGAQTIPLDKAVRTGKLANGFTYYIRKNNEPQKRVQLYLVNKVGSVLEDDDQQGLAHFMEHMNFNGTKHYPKNDLVDYLQKAGVRFGADLNAYTSFDETVYELPLPTDDATMTASGLNIMRDWAQEALLDSVEIEKERGVVLEEERLGKGASDRMARKFYPVMLNHSRYAERLPIGIDKVLINFKPAIIKRFYHDWYRPDLQALIVVGDVNVDEVEKLIREQFADLKNPSNERSRTKYSVPLTGHAQFLTVTDKEKPSTEIEILYKHKAPVLKTEADYLESIKRSLFNQLLAARRYAEISQKAKPAFTNMNANIQGILGGLDAFTFDVTPKSGQLQQAVEQSWLIVEKVKRYGFTRAELDRAKQNYLRSLENGLKEKDKTPSDSYVKEYQRLFLQQEASPGIVWENDFAKKHIDQIKLADVTALMNDYFKSADVDILVLAPEKDKSTLPDSATLSSWINNVNKSDIKPFKDDEVSQTLLAIKPKPGKVIAKSAVPQINVTELTLSNGVKVILKPTDFKNDEIRFTAFSPGGTSLYNDADYDNAANAAALMSRFGLGNLNPVQLSKVLNGKQLNVAASIAARSENINGFTSIADLETALQLVYMQFTKPRKDSTLFNNIINNAKESLTNRYADPNNVFADTVNYVMGNYSFRSSPTSAERLDKISMQKAYNIYKERFADAAGFTFVFVGNFNIETVTPLLEQYLGSLPSLRKNEKPRDLGIHIPAGLLTKKVYKGAENKAIVRLLISGDYQYSAQNNLLLKALGDILQIKVLQHLREEESEVYSPSVQTLYNKYPKNRYAFTVSFGCAPKNADHLIAMVKKEMETLISNGAEADDIQKFKAAYEKNVELALNDNGFWLSYLSSQYENDENVLQVLDAKPNLAKVTPETLKQAAQVYLSGNNIIRFELLPENMSTN
ncbi:M16 family metallopeptidase [Mucilaginibacter sp. OK098]|uniref:M16 family metallopeptidase n=1 Tax=Mucilaginibacter sp. OK098 TaxID=1855297 RepID=UPI0009101D24|nr:M16 family metallopeptidase [Mucilaginibacter sp. OK098]SHM58818.1 zinc protease [Mucilaginibacter sp. OK098]